MSLLTQVVIPTAILAGLAALAAPNQQHVAATAKAAAPSPMEAATAYANEHGLTGCGQPADADLDDVFLTVPSDPAGVVTDTTVTPVDLDTALDSAGKRVVLLACHDLKETP